MMISPLPSRDPATRAAVAMSVLHAPRAAGAEAARRACAALGTAPSCCLVFATAGYPQEELLAGVRSQTGAAQLFGCSGEGIIAGACADERERVVTVLAISSAAIEFEDVSRSDYASAPDACGRGLAADVTARGLDDAIALILFTDGLSGHCGRFLAALEAGLPKGFVVVGGTAGDCMEFTQTYQYVGDRVMSGAVSAVLLRGRGRARVAVSHGCIPIGLEHTVTDASDGWLREIDGRPAWSVFKEYLDGDPVDLNAEGIVHLCFGEPLSAHGLGDYDPFIIRTPLRLDATSGAMFFPGGGFTTGSRVRMTRRDPDRIRASAMECARSFDGSERPAFVLQFDCAGRGRILFGSCAADEIVKPLQKILGGEASWVGFHTYGEIAPVADRLYYHNYTVALCAIYDVM